MLPNPGPKPAGPRATQTSREAPARPTARCWAIWGNRTASGDTTAYFFTQPAAAFAPVVPTRLGRGSEGPPGGRKRPLTPAPQPVGLRRTAERSGGGPNRGPSLSAVPACPAPPRPGRAPPPFPSLPHFRCPAVAKPAAAPPLPRRKGGGGRGGAVGGEMGGT